MVCLPQLTPLHPQTPNLCPQAPWSCFFLLGCRQLHLLGVEWGQGRDAKISSPLSPPPPRAKGKPCSWGVILAVSGSCCVDGILLLLGSSPKPSIPWDRQGPPIPLPFAQSCRNHFIAVSREPSSLSSQVWGSLWQPGLQELLSSGEGRPEQYQGQIVSNLVPRAEKLSCWPFTFPRS